MDKVTKNLQLDAELLNGNKQLTEEVNPFLHVYFPAWDNKPKVQPPVLILGETSVLTHQNVGAIIANPGFGKSSICEAILAAYLNPNIDSLGWGVSESCKGILYIDNEQVNEDVWKSFKRMCDRAKIPYNGNTPNVKIAGLRAIPRLKERLQAIEALLQEREYSILIIDGAGDLVLNTNELLEAIECRILFREWTVKYNLSILTTLHPNKNTNTPRGHTGSEICREAESVLIVKKMDGDKRVITTDFEHGNYRNGAEITVGYQWSENDHMFISCDIETNNQQKEMKNQLIAFTIVQELPALFAWSHTELVKHIEETKGDSASTAKRKIANMTKLELIKKGPDGLYRKQ